MIEHKNNCLPELKYINFLKWPLVFGLIWLALGVAYIPVNKIYQQGVVLFLYVPVLILLVTNISFLRDIYTSEKIFFWILTALLVYAGINGAIKNDLKIIKHPMYVFLFLISGVFIIAANYSEKAKGTVKHVVLGGVLIIALYVMYNFFIVHGYPITGQMWGVNGLVHTILASYYIGFFLLLSMLLVTEKKQYRFVVLVLVLGAYILFAQSRGAYGALFAAMLAYTVLFTNKNKTALVFMLFCIVSAIVLGFFYSEQITSRGFSYRPEILKASIELGLKNPWFGIGLDNNYLVYSPNFPQGALHPHNLFVHVFIELGLVGLLLCCALWLYSLYYCYIHRFQTVARFAVVWMVFSGIAVQTDAASFIAQPRLEWIVVWVPIFLTVVIIAMSYLKKSDLTQCISSSNDE